MIKFYPLLLLCLIGQLTGLYHLSAQTPDIAWAKQGIGNMPGTGQAVAHDASGNTFVTGEFEGGITFNNNILQSSGFTDVFIAKYDAAGTLRWGRKAGGDSYEVVYAIAVDGAGNAYITGRFSGTASFGTTSLTSSGISNMYLAKYDPDGTLLWVQQAGGSQNTIGRGLAVDEAGNAYVTGNFFGQATFGTTMLTSSGSDDIFVAKYTAAGVVEWAQRAGGTNTETGKSIAIDGAGNAYIAAFYSSEMLTFGDTMIPVGGRNALLIAKFDPNGQAEWARRVGDVVGSNDFKVAASKSGFLYLTGSFTNFMDIGGHPLIAAGSSDVFLAKFDRNGFAQWAQSAGGTAADMSRGIALDRESNAYITGSFMGTAHFGSTTLTSDGRPDIFISKFDSLGHVQWAERFGGKGIDIGYGISADDTGNVFATGKFQDATTFEDTTLTGGYATVYAVKLDAATGDLKWVQSPAVVGATAIGRSVVVDEAGNSYATGYFSGSTTFGSTTLSSEGYHDIFITSYDAEGNVRWAQQAGGQGSDNGYGIALDGNGNFYVAGQFEGTATFGNITLISAGNADIFLAKYDAAGNIIWARQAGASGNDIAFGLAVDASGNAYITGSFSGTVSFGLWTYTSAGSTDIFLAKYNASGEVVLAQRAGGAGFDTGRAISVDGSGNAYVTGSFQSAASFGKTTLASKGMQDSFVFQCDNQGTIQWAKGGGGGGNDAGNAIAVDAAGKVYITGEFHQTATFGNTPLTSAGLTDIFVAGYDATGNEAWAQRAGGAGIDYGYGIAVDEAGNAYITGNFSGTADFGGFTVTSAYTSLFLARYDATGSAQWVHQTSQEGSSTGYSVTLHSSGSAFLTGHFSGKAIFGGTTLNSSYGEEMLLARIALTATPTGIPGNRLASHLTLYPIPSSDKLTILMPLTEKTNLELRLLDVNGKLLLKQNYSSITGEFNQVLDLRDKTSGVYLLQLQTDQEVITKRIVKE